MPKSTKPAEKPETTQRVAVRQFNWRYALGEVGIVATGVLLAFQLNTWKEGNNNRDLEQSSIVMLYNEVQKDSAIFYQYYQQANYHKRDALAILAMLNSENPHNFADSLSDCFRRCGSYSGSVLHRSAFLMMSAQGTLNLVKNDSLKNSIYSYYDYTHSVVQIWSTFEMKMVDDVIPKLYKNGVVDDAQVLTTNGLRIFYKEKEFVDELLKAENKSRIAVYMRSQNDMINVTNLNRRVNRNLLIALRKYIIKF